MKDYYLKFSDEAAANAVLFTSVAEEKNEQGSVVVEASTTPNYANMSIIGTIYKDEVALEGWHVNVRTEASEELEPYRVFPAAPMRVWA